MLRHFIDRMENPVHGLAENEAYSARFAELVARDENLYKLLTAEDLGPHDVDLLSTTAWLWFLKWLKDEAVPMPGTSFLGSLYDHVGDPVAKLSIVDIVVSAPYLAESFRSLDERNVYLEDLPGFWLRDRLLGIVQVRDERETLNEEFPAQFAEAIEITTFLLQIGNVVALTTLRSFLAYPWRYQEELRQVVDERLRISTESERDHEEWRRRLGLNERHERR